MAQQKAEQTAPQGVNGWAGQARHVGEPEEKALRRRVRMHEFLMTGGIYLGVDSDTKKGVYSEPIDPITVAEKHPDCPWHGVDPDGTKCSAWVEIVNGRGTGEIVSPTLPELRDMTDEDLTDARTRIRVARDQKDGLNGHEPGENPRKGSAYRPAPSASKPGERVSFGGSQHRSAEPHYKPTKPKNEDARDAAMDALGGENIPDRIEIEGDEDE